MTTVIVSVILSALAALVTCVLLARFDVGGRILEYDSDYLSLKGTL